jgi:hypothetical protein
MKSFDKKSTSTLIMGSARFKSRRGRGGGCGIIFPSLLLPSPCGMGWMREEKGGFHWLLFAF